MSDKCPICATEMTEYHDVIDVYNGMGPTSEHYLDCPNKCYSFNYSFGHTVVYVELGGHHIPFGWSYDTDPQTIRDEAAAIEIVCEVARHGRSNSTVG